MTNEARYVRNVFFLLVDKINVGWSIVYGYVLAASADPDDMNLGLHYLSKYSFKRTKGQT